MLFYENPATTLRKHFLFIVGSLKSLIGIRKQHNFQLSIPVLCSNFCYSIYECINTSMIHKATETLFLKRVKKKKKKKKNSIKALLYRGKAVIYSKLKGLVSHT